MKRVISYASRGLNKAEKNYPPHKREFLALKWSICDKFKDYLYGHRFTVLTNNNPVTYVLTTAKLDATGHRWLAALSTFNFDIKYRPGKNNTDADALSRLPAVHDSEGCTITLNQRQPTLLRSGEFDICKSAISTTADWEKKITCILQLATNSPIFQTLQAESGQAILSILSTSNTQS